ncbi:hypothetical protein [Agathobaculum sp. Marseille-P7918]|uniref:hypothetical protein n=1 Tax=Agathobaculum sp. Marseille-P7918 TaxID=2479843 RepID=UPI000F641046|nr:hypothetical protein [Agathobaculum sp. Marseille-P7918]
MFVVHFFFTSFGSSLSNKVMQIGSVTQSQVDKLTYDRTMVASFQPHITGLPKSGYGIITLYSYEDFTKQNGAQEVFYTDGERYWRKAVNDSVSPWYRVATGTPPQEYNLPLVDGISGTAKYSKDQFGIVRVYMAAVKDSGTITNNEILGTLPEGFRPKTSFAVVGYGNSNPNSISDRHPVNMYISSNGDITASFLSETDAMKIASLYGTTEFLSES